MRKPYQIHITNRHHMTRTLDYFESLEAAENFISEYDKENVDNIILDYNSRSKIAYARRMA